MARRIVKLPDIGEGVAEAEVTAWHVKIGDVVREDQPLADVMTDKATVEIPSPASGTIVALGGETGQMLAVGAALVTLETEGGADEPAPAPKSATAPPQATTPAPSESKSKPAPAAAPARAGTGRRVVKLPDIGEGVAEAEIAAWHVKVGDVVREDQPLADVMTDKATVEIPSPASGTVVALGGETGQMLAVGAALVTLAVEGGADTPAAAPKLAAPSPQAPAPAGAGEPAAVRRPASSAAPKPARTTMASLGPPRPEGEKPVASPAVRKRAMEAGVDLRLVRGTGPAGRISHDDLDAFMQGGGPAPAEGTARVANTSVEEIKVVGLRRRIAQKMAESKRRAAHFSYVDECDVTALEELRAALNRKHGERRGKLTLIPFLVQALVKTLPDFPQMNVHYDDEADVIHRFGGVHAGIATQTPTGLMVPVIRHAEARDVWEIGAEVKRLADAARSGLTTREELSGSTITITSLGALGGIVTTPVLNRPEVAILGVNKQVMRPVWQGGEFVPRLTMNLSASFDHRVVDGYDAALFVQAIKALLETPAMLFMEG